MRNGQKKESIEMTVGGRVGRAGGHSKESWETYASGPRAVFMPSPDPFNDSSPQPLA